MSMRPYSDPYRNPSALIEKWGAFYDMVNSIHGQEEMFSTLYEFVLSDSGVYNSKIKVIPNSIGQISPSRNWIDSE